MTGRHLAAPGRPAKRAGVALGRQLTPPRHAAEPVDSHEHVFEIVAEFGGIRAAITECRGRLADGSVCHQTKTLWAL